MRLIDWLYEAARRSAEAHAAFLMTSQTVNRQTAGIIAHQLMGLPINLDLNAIPPQQNPVHLDSNHPQQYPVHLASTPVRKLGKPIFTRAQLDEFATGSPAVCFGESYRRFEGRRIPRIPNGDFLLMSRVTQIDCDEIAPHPGASITVEYDVPAEPWFLSPGKTNTPFSILQEIALQPCGFLTAYLGTMLIFPDQEFFFRNLDGQAELIRYPDLRGKTITCQATLTTHTAGAGTMIQGFRFSLSCDRMEFFRGQSVFGYFSPEVMANQTGLDRDRPTQPWSIEHPEAIRNRVNLSTYNYRKVDKLNLLDEALLIEGGGRYSQGYIQAVRSIRPSDWFFERHFYQDPVMPGSLGVEACLQAMELFGQTNGLGKHAILVPGNTTTWKYRGQITPVTKRITVEAHIQHITPTPDGIVLTGDAVVWGDHLRLYEIRQAALCLVPDERVEKGRK